MSSTDIPNLKVDGSLPDGPLAPLPPSLTNFTIHPGKQGLLMDTFQSQISNNPDLLSSDLPVTNLVLMDLFKIPPTPGNC